MRPNPEHRAGRLARLTALALGSLALAGAAPPAGAGETPREAPGAITLTPMLGYRAGGRFDEPEGEGRRRIDDDAGFAVAVNLRQAPGRFYEALYSRQRSRLGGAEGLAVDLEYFHLGGMLARPGESLVPFLSATAGITRLAPRGPAQSRLEPSISLGEGAHLGLTARLGLRLEGRGYLTLADSDEALFCVSAPPETAGCAARFSGDALLQFEALVGLRVAF